MTPAPDADRFRNVLAFALIGAFIFVIGLLVFKTLDAANKDIITYMVGQLSGMATTALGFYFVNKAGQDALDSKRAETTGKMAEAITAAAQATPPADTASRAADAVADAATDKADEIKAGAS
jgi:hypothetical protein